MISKLEDISIKMTNVKITEKAIAKKLKELLETDNIKPPDKVVYKAKTYLK